MWIPQTWNDLEIAIGTLSEGDQLDFKRELATGKKLNDIAKDAAAMSLQGGVILVGVDEDSGLAISINPIPLSGAIERIRQVLDSRVRPSLGAEVTPLTKNPGDQKGVIIITIPSSWSAPHQYDGRFPARSGPVTRWLIDSELETLFERRASLRHEAAGQAGMTEHQIPPNMRLQHLEDVGVMRLLVRPPVKVRHPEEPRLKRSLVQATLDAPPILADFLGRFTPRTFDFLGDWRPAGPYAWASGRFTATNHQIRGHGMVGAVYRYGHGFSFTTQLSLLSGMEPDAPPGAAMAQEHHWAIELLAQFAIAGAFYRHLAEASLLRVDLELGGLLDSVSNQASGGLAFDSDAPRVTENLYSVGDLFPASEFWSDPRDPVRRLLDPFMVAILEEGIDLIDWIATA